MGKFYLNDEEVEVLSTEVLNEMSERLSTVVSVYFTSHPEEYLRFLESRRTVQQKAAKMEDIRV